MPRGNWGSRERWSLKYRLLRKTEKTESCWLWKGSMQHAGHGSLKDAFPSKKKIQAHRASWEIHKGPIPDGLCVLHKCDVPNCVNPDHLFLGTKHDNTQDMIAKGRMKVGSQLPGAKLTESDVRKILLSDETNTSLAQRFGVDQSIISEIINRKRWKHVTV